MDRNWPVSAGKVMPLQSQAESSSGYRSQHLGLPGHGGSSGSSEQLSGPGRSGQSRCQAGGTVVMERSCWKRSVPSQE